MACILVVDDDVQIVELVRALFETAGHEVISSTDPGFAVPLLTHARIDAVVLDVVMPDKSGFDVLHALRSDPGTAPVPVLFLSALGGGADRLRGLREGADDYLAKPFEPEELLLRVERLLARGTGGANGNESLEAVRRALSTAGADALPFRLETPVRLGRYELLEVIGRGAFGMVFRAFDPRLQREVAVKTVHLERTTTHRRAQARGLLEEAVRLARLSHPNVVSVYDVAEVADVAYLTLELVHGTNLEACLNGRHALRLSDAVPLGAALAHGLAAAHAIGLVHRDVKPGNVLLGLDGSIKLTDFGLSGGATTAASADASGRPVIYGTPGFVAPETLLGHGCDEHGDLFALGAILYECLTGVPPFADETGKVDAWNPLRVLVVPPKLREPLVPDDLNELVLGLLARDLAARRAAAPNATWVAHLLDGMARERGYEWGAARLLKAPTSPSGLRPRIRLVTAPNAPLTAGPGA